LSIIENEQVYKRPRAARPMARAPPIAGTACGTAAALEAAAEAEDIALDAATLADDLTELKLEATPPVAVESATLADDASELREESTEVSPLRMLERRVEAAARTGLVVVVVNWAVAATAKLRMMVAAFILVG
jgi:hypothetical protein